ncbi:MAG: hypothetical protein MUO72_18450, partial [Bacteroidales bacterium]|nr:hypothetical protein [Bacteroidales bacterium]
MNERVAGLLFKIRADTTALRQGMKQTQAAVGSMQKSMELLKGTLIATFSITAAKRLFSFGIELIELGDIVGDVREAFDRLNQPYLLDKLRKATFGMIN